MKSLYFFILLSYSYDYLHAHQKTQTAACQKIFFSPGNDSELLPDSVIIVSQDGLKSLYMHEDCKTVNVVRTTDYAHHHSHYRLFKSLRLVNCVNAF